MKISKNKSRHFLPLFSTAKLIYHKKIHLYIGNFFVSKKPDYNKKLKIFLKKSVTFFISADYIYRIIDNKKSLFSHVLSILLHRRLHRTQFCIIIYPEKASVRQKYIAACIAYSRLENDNHLSTPIWVQRQRLPHLCRCAASRSGR